MSHDNSNSDILIIAYENDEDARLIYTLERIDCSDGDTTKYSQFKSPIISERETT